MISIIRYSLRKGRNIVTTEAFCNIYDVNSIKWIYLIHGKINYNLFSFFQNKFYDGKVLISNYDFLSFGLANKSN